MVTVVGSVGSAKWGKRSLCRDTRTHTPHASRLTPLVSRLGHFVPLDSSLRRGISVRKRKRSSAGPTPTQSPHAYSHDTTTTTTHSMWQQQQTMSSRQSIH